MWSFAVARQARCRAGPRTYAEVRCPTATWRACFWGSCFAEAPQNWACCMEKTTGWWQPEIRFSLTSWGTGSLSTKVLYIPGGAGFLPKNFERQTHIMIPILFQLLRWDWTESPRIFGRSWKIQVLYIDRIRAPTEIKKIILGTQRFLIFFVESLSCNIDTQAGL